MRTFANHIGKRSRNAVRSSAPTIFWVLGDYDQYSVFRCRIKAPSKTRSTRCRVENHPGRENYSKSDPIFTPERYPAVSVRHHAVVVQTGLSPLIVTRLPDRVCGQ